MQQIYTEYFLFKIVICRFVASAALYLIDNIYDMPFYRALLFHVQEV